MTKRKNAAAASKPGPAQIPQIEIKEAPPPQNFVGVFNPTLFEMPSHEQLVGLLMLLGLQTNLIAGEDTNKNLVNAAGNVIVPATLRQFFKLVPVAPAS